MCAILGYCGRGASYEVMQKALQKTATRGPDDSRILDTGNGFLGFNRLAIMDLSDAGMQPFTRNGNAVVCNGEIYDFRELKELLEEDGYTFTSGSDCELLLPLWEKYGVHMFRMLDAEFAMVLYDKASDSYIAARAEDPGGPLQQDYPLPARPLLPGRKVHLLPQYERYFLHYRRKSGQRLRGDS